MGGHVILGITPADPSDRGEADPDLVAALMGNSTAHIRVCLLQARLLVPVVAAAVEDADADAEAEMTVPLLVSADGRRALPVFSSYDALRAWRPDARPVPMTGARVFAAAAAEGYDGVVLDVAGPAQHTVADSDLRVMAKAGEALVANPEAQVLPIE